MKRKISYERLFATGKWENERIGIETELDEKDELEEAFRVLRRQVQEIHIKGPDWDEEDRESIEQAQEKAEKLRKKKELEKELKELEG